jgi:hypothetical protein
MVTAKNPTMSARQRWQIDASEVVVRVTGTLPPFATPDELALPSTIRINLDLELAGTASGALRDDTTADQ